MYWKDPNLYGFAYKDINTPVQTPFMGPVFNPWQDIPKFLPPTYGITPQFPYPQVPFNYIPQTMYTPQLPQFTQQVPQFTPQVPQFTPQVPQFTPWPHAFNMNLPFFNLYRPFTY